MSFRRWLLFLALLLVVTPVGAARSALRPGSLGAAPRSSAPSVLRVRNAPLPTALPLAAELLAPCAADFARDGVETLLDESRIRLERTSVERFERVVERAINDAGVETASEHVFAIAPAEEELLLHQVLVRRDGAVLDKLAQVQVQSAQREPDADQRIFTGELTVWLVVPDVRAGDVVDVAYTIRSRGPFFDGRWSGSLELGRDVPVRSLVAEVVSVGRAPLRWRGFGGAPAPEESTNGKEATLRWQLRDTRVAGSIEPDEDGDPPAAPSADEAADGGVPFVQLSEHTGWAEVAEWGTRQYLLSKPSSLIAAAAAEQSGGADQPIEERAAALVRFVQDQIRYLGLELGDHSFVPREPEHTLQQRLGDCKDKALLLVALLRELGIEASPVLVATDDDAALPKRLPAVTAFDHVVVLARHGGREVLLDPTISGQGGALFDIAPSRLRHGLVLREGEQALRSFTPAPLRRAEEELLLEYREGASVVQLDVRAIERDRAADSLRERLARGPLKAVTDEWLVAYKATHPELRVSRAPQANDDRRKNEITIRAVYTLQPIAEFDGTLTLLSPRLESLLAAPENTPAALPLPHPTWVIEETVVHTAFPFEPMVSSGVEKDRAVSVNWELRGSNGVARLRREYRTYAERVERAQLDEHLAMLERARAVLPVRLLATNKPPKAPARRVDWYGFFAAIGLWAVVIALILLSGSLSWWWGRRRFRRWRSNAPQRGETPDLALVVASVEDATRSLGALRCSCGGAPMQTAPTRTELRFGGGKLWLLAVACERCSEPVKRYFTLK